MKKSELRTGMRVTLRNNETYYVMLKAGRIKGQEDFLIHKVGRETGWMPLWMYSEDNLTFHDSDEDILPSDTILDAEWDIMKVETFNGATEMFMPSHYKTIWERG